MIRYPMVFILIMSLAACGRPGSAPGSTDNQAEPETDSDNHQSDNPARGKNDWSVEYANMESALLLSDEEASRLKDAFETRQTEVSSWLAVNGAKLESLEKQMAAAAKSRDLRGVKNATAEATPLRNDLRDLVATHKDAIVAALSAENQTIWSAHQLSQRILESMTALALTEEQIKQIRTEAVKTVQTTTREPNPEAAGFLKLEKTVESRFLTADQRTAYEEEKKNNPFRSLR